MNILIAAEKMAKDGIVQIPFNTAHLVQPVAEIYKTFLCEPEEYKRLWTFDADAAQDHDDGYIRRDDEEHKSFFHFRPILPIFLAQNKVDHARYLSWLNHCETLYKACMQKLFEFGGALDSVMPGYGFKTALQKHHYQSKLRLLMYDKEFENASLAEPHTDKGLLTMHVAESRPGFHSHVNGPLIGVPKNTCLIFAGQQAEKGTQGLIRHVWHHVSNENKNAEERWSMTLFGKGNLMRQPS
ncbi:2OG-Fe(II) oxygenase family protein [bacterium]|nr:2OG-Fe(II) oxygenase family protein [bacterium]